MILIPLLGFGQIMYLGDTPPPTGGSFTYDSLTVTIAAGEDDQEEGIGCCSGAMEWNSTDLEVTQEGGIDDQIVGLQYNSITIPQGATIDSAFVQFTLDSQTGTYPNKALITCEDVDNSADWTNSLANSYFTNATKTTAVTTWYVSSDNQTDAVGSAGPAQRTVNIAAPIQEVINRGGWSSGNRLAIFFSPDTTEQGETEFETYDTSPSQAPVLKIYYKYL